MPPSLTHKYTKAPGAHLGLNKAEPELYPGNHISFFIKKCMMKTRNLQSRPKSELFKQNMIVYT